MLLDLSKRHALTLWEGWGRCYQGVLLINSGDSGNGSGLLQAGLNALGGAKFGVRLITFLGNVTLALGRAGQIAAGLSEVDKAVRQFGQAKENWWITDLLRSKGELLLLQGAPGAARAAEDLFQEALDWAHRQGMLSLELRAATSLARLLRSQGRLADAMAVLQPVCDRLTEGFATADVIAAKQLLDS
jgi:predicted ATPase